jgi:hypothetical protein
MMVISKDEFAQKKIDPNMQRVGKNQASILAYLRQSPREAFSQAELQEALEIEHMSAVNYALHSLRRKGLVENKIVDGTIYWRAVDDKAVPGILPESDGSSQDESLQEEE